MIGLKFHAFHGCHPLEAKTGGEFEVDIHVDTSFNQELTTDEIGDAIDYVLLMDIAETQMKVRCNLIEKVAANIAKSVQSRINRPHRIRVEVRKLMPPVQHELRHVSVSVELSHGMNK